MLSFYVTVREKINFSWNANNCVDSASCYLQKRRQNYAGYFENRGSRLENYVMENYKL